MDNKNLNLIFYHYIHFTLVENFGEKRIVACHDVCNFIAQKFRAPRQIKKKVIIDLDALGLVELIRGDKIIIKEPVKVLSF